MITRRTITPFSWDVVARCVLLLITSGVSLFLHRLSDGETVMWIPVAVFYVLLVVNVLTGLLPVTF